jgi:hypothetical protein
MSVYYNGNSFQLFFSDFFNSLFVTHTILDILIVLIVGFADKDIEYYSIQCFVRPSSHSCIYFSFSFSILFVLMYLSINYTNKFPHIFMHLFFLFLIISITFR